MKLALAFEYNPLPELVEVIFVNSIGQEVTSYRRKSLIRDYNAGSFQWTVGVKAFSILVLGSYLSSLENKIFNLEGEEHSFAASLDYAINKPTEWIADIFGKDARGRVLANKIFRRENSERKLPGPVRIALSSSFYEKNAIKIFKADEEIKDRALIQHLFNSISGLKDKKSKAEPAETLFATKWFENLMFTELSTSLGETELMQNISIKTLPLLKLLPEQYKKAAKEVIDRICSNLEKLQTFSTAMPSVSVLKKFQQTQKPLRVLAVPMAIGPLAILNFLKDEFKLPIEIDISTPSTSSATKTLSIDSYDLLLLSWNTLLKQKINNRYSALMLMPRTSFECIFVGQEREFIKQSDFLLATDSLGYPNLYLKKLVIEKQIKNLKINKYNASIAEINTYFSQQGKKEKAAILGFPFSAIIANQNKLQIYRTKNLQTGIGDNILMAQKRFKQSDKLELVQMIRYAWHILLEENSLKRQHIKKIISHPNYQASLKRIGNLYK